MVIQYGIALNMDAYTMTKKPSKSMRYKPKFKVGDHVQRRLSGETVNQFTVNQFIIKSGYISDVIFLSMFCVGNYRICNDDRSGEYNTLSSPIDSTDDVYVLYDSPEGVWARI